MYVYLKSSPETWTVGYFTNAGEQWNAESDHFSEEAAQKQVARLNGGEIRDKISELRKLLDAAVSERDALLDERNALRDEVAELKRKVADLTGQRDELRVLNAELLDALNSLLTRVERDARAVVEKLNSPAK